MSATYKLHAETYRAHIKQMEIDCTTDYGGCLIVECSVLFEGAVLA